MTRKLDTLSTTADPDAPDRADRLQRLFRELSQGLCLVVEILRAEAGDRCGDAPHDGTGRSFCGHGSVGRMTR